MKFLIKLVFVIIFITIIFCSCNNAIRGLDNKNNILEKTYTQNASSLTYLEELRIINLAANYLKDLGLNVAFQETYIEYHNTFVPITLELDKKAIGEYVGEYLEVKFYYSENLNRKLCEECTTVYIDKNGHVIGHNRALYNE